MNLSSEGSSPSSCWTLCFLLTPPEIFSVLVFSIVGMNLSSEGSSPSSCWTLCFVLTPPEIFSVLVFSIVGMNLSSEGSSPSSCWTLCFVLTPPEIFSVLVFSIVGMNLSSEGSSPSSCWTLCFVLTPPEIFSVLVFSIVGMNLSSEGSSPCSCWTLSFVLTPPEIVKIVKLSEGTGVSVVGTCQIDWFDTQLYGMGRFLALKHVGTREWLTWSEHPLARTGVSGLLTWQLSWEQRSGEIVGFLCYWVTGGSQTNWSNGKIQTFDRDLLASYVCRDPCTFEGACSSEMICISQMLDYDFNDRQVVIFNYIANIASYSTASINLPLTGVYCTTQCYNSDTVRWRSEISPAMFEYSSYEIHIKCHEMPWNAIKSH